LSRSTLMRLQHLVGLVLILTLVETSRASETLPAACQWIPAEAIAEVEVSRPDAVLDFLLSPELVKAVSGLPAYQKATAQPQFQQFLGMVRFLEFQLQTD